MTQEEKDVPGRRITDEYYADGEWYYDTASKRCYLRRKAEVR